MSHFLEFYSYSVLVEAIIYSVNFKYIIYTPDYLTPDMIKRLTAWRRFLYRGLRIEKGLCAYAHSPFSFLTLDIFLFWIFICTSIFILLIL